MALTPEAYAAHVAAHTDSAGRLPVSPMVAWEVFPFEPDGLRVVPLAAPQLPEPPRGGEGGRPCNACAATATATSTATALWSDEDWRLEVVDSGAPLVLLLYSVEHLDLSELDDRRAGQLGRLIVHLVRAVEALPHIARAHVSRWGDGGSHLHVFVYARPAGFGQLRGTCFGIWDDLLPPVPHDVRDADARAVATALVSSFGGTAG